MQAHNVVYEIGNPPGADATFLGWQWSGKGELFPLYNITAAGHPSLHSTVSDVTLHKLHLQVPRTPSPYPGVTPCPWQRLGIELYHPATAKEAIMSAGLDYTVVREQVKATLTSDRDAYVTKRTDTGETLSVVDKGYTPTQNRDAFSFFDSIVRNKEAVYETAGIIGHGERIWILARLSVFMKIHGNDLVHKYLLLTNSHSGGGEVRVRIAPIRVVCNNTLTSALQGSVGDVTISQRYSAEQGKKEATALLESSHILFGQLQAIFNVMAERRIDDETFREYVIALVPHNPADRNNAKTEEIRNEVLRLHESGRCASLGRGTWWGAFNSVTEYTDHQMRGTNESARLDSIWFGSGEELKKKAFRQALHMMKIS